MLCTSGVSVSVIQIRSNASAYGSDQNYMGPEAGSASDGASSLLLRVSQHHSHDYLAVHLIVNISYYGVIIPCIFNMIGMCGFSILNSILGGQTLAAVSNDNLSWT